MKKSSKPAAPAPSATPMPSPMNLPHGAGPGYVGHVQNLHQDGLTASPILPGEYATAHPSQNGKG